MARPREFDYEKVVNQVMEVFWARGFQGTSVDDITAVTGLKKGSLYSAFGNKEALFRLALRKYIGDGPFKCFRGDEISPDPVNALVLLYRKLINESQVPKHGKRGCLVFNSGIEFGNQSTSLSRFVIEEVERLETFFYELIKEAIRIGSLSKKLDVRKASFRAFAAAFTIKEMAKFRPDRDLLSEIANAALQSLGTERRV